MQVYFLSTFFEKLWENNIFSLIFLSAKLMKAGEWDLIQDLIHLSLCYTEHNFLFFRYLNAVQLAMRTYI